jgi:putative salt-induced outer membrane protein YdiY
MFPLAVSAEELPTAINKSNTSSSTLASNVDILASLETTQPNTVIATESFSASAQLGLLYLTGNTRSADMKVGLDLRFEQELWRSSFIFDSLIKKVDVNSEADGKHFETSENKWSAVTQTNYTINTAKKNYLYGNLSYEENKFSSFDSQVSISTGWGRRWFETSKASLDADIGPGFKRDVTRESQADRDAGIYSETQDSLILQAQALYRRKMNEHIEFKQLLIAKYAIESGQNSSYKAESSITSKLIESLQLKLSFLIDYNSTVDEDKTNTDTQTSVVLVYSF